MDFTPREIDAERARALRARRLLGRPDASARCSPTGCATPRPQPFTVRSDRTPYRGTLGDVDALARRVAAGHARARRASPATRSRSSCRTGSRRRRRSTRSRTSARSSCRSCTSTARRKSAYILARTRVKALVTADRFGAQDFLANLDTMRADLPDLEWVAVVGDEPRPGQHPRSPTSSPTSRSTTLGRGRPARARARRVHVGHDDRPEGRRARAPHDRRRDPPARRHPARRRCSRMPTSAEPARDHRRAGRARHRHARRAAHAGVPPQPDPPHRRVGSRAACLQAMLDDGLSAGQGSTFFLTSLLDHPDFDPARHVPLMPVIGLGGSAVPAAVGERCASSSASTIARSFGSTEHPSITGCSADVAAREAAQHRRRAAARRRDPARRRRRQRRRARRAGRDLEPRARAASSATPIPPSTAAAFAPDGWFMTGDIGVLDADGYLAITDRKKDIIIRGGENVSAAEVEEILVRMPDVAEVAVVAAPDARLGEIGVRALPHAARHARARSRRGARHARRRPGSPARSGRS